MNVNQTILVGVFDGFSWIRCEGKGSFINSPILKALGDASIPDGENWVVVDLGGCTAMDSTFMGTLAGMARASTARGGVLQIADAGERNLRSLEDLGLNYLMEINPQQAAWSGYQDAIRKELQEPPASGNIGDLKRAKLTLEAHQTLSELSEENEEKFRGVVDALEKDVAAREAEMEDPGALP